MVRVGYPLAQNTCFKWFSSPDSLVVSHTVSAPVFRHLMMPDLILAWWWELYFMYLSVCVSLRKIDVVADVRSFSTSTSRKAIFFSLSFSIVNWIPGFWEFRCFRNSFKE